MIELYYARPSLLSRPIWLALLEKQLPHQLMPVDLMAKELTPEFLKINPFGQVPVLVDGNLRIIESMAILDYLEAAYPNRPLLPTDLKLLATTRTAQFVGFNKLLPAIFKLQTEPVDGPEHQQALHNARQTLDFLQELLGDKTYFGGEQLTLAEIFIGSFLHRMPDLGMDLTNYSTLMAWGDRLLRRPSWQEIQLSPSEWHDFKRYVRLLPKIWQRRRQQRATAHRSTQ
jgi:glutathione S-transferase